MKAKIINGIITMITPKDPRYNSDDPAIKNVNLPKKPEEDPGEGMAWRAKYEENDTEIVGTWTKVEDKRIKFKIRTFSDVINEIKARKENKEKEETENVETE